MVILRSPRSKTPQKASGLKGFDDFQIRLGDMMRGERATMGKSLMDVQRELKIRAEYIAAVEDCNPTAFDTPGFMFAHMQSISVWIQKFHLSDFATKAVLNLSMECPIKRCQIEKRVKSV